MLNCRFIDHILAQLSSAGVNLSELDQHPASMPPIYPQLCPSAIFPWSIGAPYRTYPFVLHDPSSPVDPGYLLLSVDSETSQVHVRATQCASTLLDHEISCQQCLNLRVFVEFMHDHATRLPGKLDLATFSHWQCVQKVSIIENTAKTDRLNVCFILTPL